MNNGKITDTLFFQEIRRLFYILSNLTIHGKSAPIALLLWFFLGFFGLHRLYLGKTGTAILMGSFTLLGYMTLFILIGYIFWAIVWLWWIWDCIILLFMIRSPR